jgi:thiol-disulfide isomerase/thioredoxin
MSSGARLPQDEARRIREAARSKRVIMACAYHVAGGAQKRHRGGMAAFGRMISAFRGPMGLIKLMLVVGGAFVLFALLSATGGPPKPWENQEPVYRVGAVENFELTFPSAPLPDVRVTDGDNEIPLRQFANGTPLVVNLWATWCAPCLEELPSLAALQNELGGQVKVLAIAQEGGDGSRQRQFLERLGATEVTLLLDPNLGSARAYQDGSMQLPLTVLYDGRGREIGRLEGAADWSSPEAVRLVKAVVAGKRPR